MIERTPGGTPLLPGIEWRYTHTGSVVHALTYLGSIGALAHVAVCGMSPSWFNDWLGSGDQDEYERAAQLPPCRRCLLRLPQEGDGDDATKK